MPDRSYEIAVRGADWGQAARAMRDFAAATKSVSTMQGPDLAVQAERAATAWGKFATTQQAASAKVTAAWVQDAGKRAAADEAAANKRAKAAVDATRQELRDNDALGAAMQQRRGASFGSRLSTAVRSTRFGAGGVSPLVGRSLDVLGMGEAAAPITGLIGAFTALSAVTQMAAEHLNELGSAARLSGGTPGQVGALGAFGLQGDAAANAAGAFRQRITTDPFAMGFAGRMGIRALPEPFGTTNNAQFLVKAVEGLRGITNAEERLRTARVLELTWALKYLEVSPRLTRFMREQADFAAVLGKPQYTRAANEFGVASETAATAWGHLATAMGQPFIDTASEAVTRFAKGMEGLGKWVQENFGGKGTSDAIKKSFFEGGPMGGFERMLGIDTSKSIWDHLGLTGGGDSLKDAVKENTDAHKETARALGILAPGRYGGGARAARAIPDAWVGDTLNRALEAQALRRGQVIP